MHSESNGGTFTLNDIFADDDVGSRSWERIENFEGQRRQKAGDEIARELDGLQEGFADGNGKAGGTAATGNRSSNRHAGYSDSANAGESNGTGTTEGQPATGEPSDVTADSGTGESAGSQRTGKKMAKKRDPSDGHTATSNDKFADFADREPNMPIGVRPGSKPGRPKGTSDVPSSGQATESADDSNDDGQVVDGSESQSNGSSSDRSNRTSLSDRDSSRYREPNGSRFSSTPAKRGPKPKKPNDNSEKQLEPEMLGGRHWGFSEPGASIGFERDVQVDVFADKLVIAGKYETPVDKDQSRQETFEAFVSSLDRHSRDWGRPPQGFFWTPRLKFVVKPEATALYERTNSMMLRSGLSTSHEFAKTADSATSGRDARPAKKPAPRTAGKPSTGDVQ